MKEKTIRLTTMGIEQSKEFARIALNSSKEEHAHQKHLCLSLDNLRQSRQLCDVSLWCRGQELEAHRSVLAASSPYFLELFRLSGSVCDHDHVNLDALHPSGVSEALRYAYTGQASVDGSNVQHVMQAAQLFRMENLYVKSRQVLLRRINADTYVHVWNVAGRLADKYVASTVLEFAALHLSELKTGRPFAGLSVDRLRALISHFRVPTERAVDAAISWVLADEDRRVHLAELWRAAGGDTMSLSYVDRLAKQDDLMHELPELEQFIRSRRPSVDPDAARTFLLVFSERSGQTVLHTYCLETNAWSDVSHVSPFDVRVAGTAVLDNRVYCAGGKSDEDEDGYLATLHVYHPLDYQIATLASMGTSRSLLALAAHNGCLYAVGGYNASGYSAAVERYDIAFDKWTSVAPLGEPRSGVACSSVGDRLFAVGGRNECDILSTVEYFSNEQWTLASPMPLARNHASAGALGDNLYVVGGLWGVQDLVKTSLGSIQCLSTMEDKWTLADGTVPNVGLITAALAWQNRLYVLTTCGRIYVFDANEDKVRELRRAPESKGIMRAAFVIQKN